MFACVCAFSYVCVGVRGCMPTPICGRFEIWIGFTVVTNLALTASGVGMGSYPDSPGGLI